MNRRKKLKQITFVVVTTLLLICLIGIGYSAFSTNLNLNAKGNIYKESDKCYKTADNGDGTVSITSYDKNCGSVVNIPSTIKGKTVTKIINGEGWNGKNDYYSENLGAFSNRKISQVTFPDTIKYIGDFAFYSNKITTLTLPNSVEYVGVETFKNNEINYLKMSDNLKTINSLAFANNSITQINIPNSVTTLGGGAFTINKLTGQDAYIYGRNNDGTINTEILNSYASDYTETINIPNVKIIDSYAFRDMSTNQEITIPNTVEEINLGAFAWCNIKTLDIPSSIVKINNEAFRFSTGIININKTENSIAGAPWGATEATINWIGTN